MHLPRERDVPATVTIEHELTLGELTQVWTLGVGSDEVWSDLRSGTVNPVVSTTLPSNSRIGCLGFWEVRRDSWKSLQTWVSRVATALRTLVGGKTLNCIRHHPEKQNGFEIWRLLFWSTRVTLQRKKLACWKE